MDYREGCVLGVEDFWGNICLEPVFYFPSRKVAKNREPTMLSIGVTNYDRCLKKYWLVGEVDGVLPIDWVEKHIEEIVMVMRTPKGYHIYLDYHSRNPLKVMHMGYKTKVLDKGHLSIAKKRKDHYLVLRIFGKYLSDPYVYPILVNDRKMSLWHLQVLRLITSFYVSP